MSDAGDHLDDEQQAAIDTDEPAIAVLAGPGSGKTRVLSHRARRLLAAGRSEQALLLTFTNKAAAEMKSRALGVASVTSDRIWASTFHTFGLAVLRAHGDLVGIGDDFEVLDEEERPELVRNVSPDARLRNHYSQWSFKRLRQQTQSDDEVAEFGRHYEAAKRTQRVVDFDDLIVYTAQLFDIHPEIATAYATRYRHLLVDEFQDTNAAQFAIVRHLAASAASVSVFADDDQAIFRFAGAESENVRAFISELGATEYPLTINYRCRQAIVECANRLIAADADASGRQMQSFHDGGVVTVRDFDTAETEASGLAEEIAELIDSKTVAPPDIAVLSRGASRAQRILFELQLRNVPVSNWLGGAHEPPERRTLRMCLSIVRGVLSDRQAKRLSEFFGMPESEARDPVELLNANRGLPGVAPLLEVRALAWSGASVREVVAMAQNAIAAVDPKTAYAVSPILEAVDGFVAADPDFSLEHVLAELALGGVGGAPTVGGGVKVASLHRTKGLQWPLVYIVGLEEGRLPDFRATTTEQLREERRACYVGVCRAERNLTLSHARSYAGWTSTPSRFLPEMGL